MMKKLLYSSLIFLTLFIYSNPRYAYCCDNNVIKYAKDISVTILTEMQVLDAETRELESSTLITSCSGIVIHKDGKNFILTVAHSFKIPHTTLMIKMAIENMGNFTTRPIIHAIQVTKNKKGGDCITKYEIVPVKINHTNDCALLFLKGQLSTHKVRFNDKMLNAGDEILSMSSPLGIMRHDALYEGIVSYTNRKLEGFTCDIDELNMSTDSGSSGGMVFTPDGAYVGMVKGMGFSDGVKNNSYSYMIPFRVIKKWLTDEGLLWLINDDPIPEDLLVKKTVRRLPGIPPIKLKGTESEK